MELIYKISILAVLTLLSAIWIYIYVKQSRKELKEIIQSTEDGEIYEFSEGMFIIVIIDLKTAKFKDIHESKIYIDEKTANIAIKNHKQNNEGKYTYLKRTVKF